MAFEREMRVLNHIPRWSVARRMRTQMVAEHSYWVTIYAMQTAELIAWHCLGDGKLADGGNGMQMLTHAALVHDWSEIPFGDSPGPAKRQGVYNKERAKDVGERFLRDRFGLWALPLITPGLGVQEIVKFADILDEAMWLQEEIQFGNRTVYENSPTEGLDGVHAGRVTPVSMTNLRLKMAWSALRVYSTLQVKDLDDLWRSAVIPAMHSAAYRTDRVLPNPVEN